MASRAAVDNLPRALLTVIVSATSTGWIEDGSLGTTVLLVKPSLALPIGAECSLTTPNETNLGTEQPGTPPCMLSAWWYSTPLSDSSAPTSSNAPSEVDEGGTRRAAFARTSFVAGLEVRRTGISPWGPWVPGNWPRPWGWQRAGIESDWAALGVGPAALVLEVQPIPCKAGAPLSMMSRIP